MSNEKILPEVLWETPSGLLAMVLMTNQGHRCGYVGVPKGHPLYGVGYDQETVALKPIPSDTPAGQRSPFTLMSMVLKGRIPQSPEMAFDVHGGLTFAGTMDHSAIKVSVGGEGLWWFGYDCAHFMDALSPEYQAQMKERYSDRPFMWGNQGVHRTREFCKDQCVSLAEQITTLTRSRFSIGLHGLLAAFRKKDTPA